MISKLNFVFVLVVLLLAVENESNLIKRCR